MASLQKKGLITAETSGRYYLYSSLLSKDEYIQQWTRELIEKNYDNSLSRFIVAFAGNKKISKKEADELLAIIENFEEDS